MKKILVLGALALATAASAQTYPNRAVRIVVPAATGGPDIVARVVGALPARQLASLGAALLATEDDSLIEEAKKHLKRALQDEPDNGMAWYYLADAYARTGNDAMAALAMAERYYALGSYPQAMTFAQRAQTKLKEGTNDWQRANDILSTAQAGAADQRKRSR